MTGAPADAAQWTALLGAALDALPSLFPDGALGYLTVTGKVETRSATPWLSSSTSVSKTVGTWSRGSGATPSSPAEEILPS